MHLLGGEDEQQGQPDHLDPRGTEEPAEELYTGPSLLERVAALEAEVSSLRAELEALRGEPTSVAPDPPGT
jgi:uncharacterized small protein (DUF1192 family)